MNELNMSYRGWVNADRTRYLDTIVEEKARLVIDAETRDATLCEIMAAKVPDVAMSIAVNLYSRGNNHKHALAILDSIIQNRGDVADLTTSQNNMIGRVVISDYLLERRLEPVGGNYHATFNRMADKFKYLCDEDLNERIDTLFVMSNRLAGIDREFVEAHCGEWYDLPEFATALKPTNAEEINLLDVVDSKLRQLQLCKRGAHWGGTDAPDDMTIHESGNTLWLGDVAYDSINDLLGAITTSGDITITVPNNKHVDVIKRAAYLRDGHVYLFCLSFDEDKRITSGVSNEKLTAFNYRGLASDRVKYVIRDANVFAKRLAK